MEQVKEKEKTSRANTATKDVGPAKAIRRALKVVKLAQLEANNDLRSNGGDCEHYLTQAVENLEAASKWLAEYDRVEKENDKPVKTRPQQEKAEECEVCETTIVPDDLTICGGCGKPICPECMGENEVCVHCEEDDEDF
jgi:hypothetical protein